MSQLTAIGKAVGISNPALEKHWRSAPKIYKGAFQGRGKRNSQTTDPSVGIQTIVFIGNVWAKVNTKNRGAAAIFGYNNTLFKIKD